ncbi:aminotransferase class V-fold PLP-dependent enzyme [Methylotuvimicrobium sp. KM1]|uniref:aminotransferase class V-fold PLP-dependent enzyme n=1 Tax=Methylotuvimicrobium sp. KM1 TaxID=3377707 RepID=UPI00384D5965
MTTDQVLSALTDDTILVSLMHVNNETGIVHCIAATAHALREKVVFFHVNAEGKIDEDRSGQ